MGLQAHDFVRVAAKAHVDVRTAKRILTCDEDRAKARATTRARVEEAARDLGLLGNRDEVRRA